MLKSSSNHKKQKLILHSSYAIIAVATIVFYFIQNTSQLSGGNIALAKTIWLAYAILFWFALPTILILDSRTPGVWKLIFQIFLANMLIRAIFELLMLYVWNNWSTDYGVSHDIFSIALLSALAVKNRKYLNNFLFSSTIAVFFLMFVAEIIFVSYMASNITGAGSSVFFVPDSNEHRQIIIVTWVVNILLTIYLYYFSRALIHEK
jgi:hypothetical protein